MRCLHSIGSYRDKAKNKVITMSILIPHYEVFYFAQRVFHIEIEGKKYLELTGEELKTLQTNEGITK